MFNIANSSYIQKMSTILNRELNRKKNKQITQVNLC